MAEEVVASREDVIDRVYLLRKLHTIVFFVVIGRTPMVRRRRGLAYDGVVLPVSLNLANTTVVGITILRISYQFHIQLRFEPPPTPIVLLPRHFKHGVAVRHRCSYQRLRTHP